MLVMSDKVETEVKINWSYLGDLGYLFEEKEIKYEGMSACW